ALPPFGGPVGAREIAIVAPPASPRLTPRAGQKCRVAGRVLPCTLPPRVAYASGIRAIVHTKRDRPHNTGDPGSDGSGSYARCGVSGPRTSDVKMPMAAMAAHTRKVA